MSKPSRKISAGIKREVRQRCGFGCVMCGLPLYEYDHLDGWAETHLHVAQRIILLCDRHHRERTAGLLPNERVEQGASQPFNLQTGVSRPYTLHFAGTRCKIIFGNNDFTSDRLAETKSLTALMIDNVALVQFRLEDGHLLLTLRVFDRMNHLVLYVEDNELVFRVDQWDVELIGRRLVIREAARLVLMDVLFDPPSRIAIERGRFILNGVHVLVTKEHGIQIENSSSVFCNSGFGNWDVGILIGECDESLASAVFVPDVPRYVRVANLT